MLSELFIKLFTNIAYLKALRCERRVGYKLILHNLSQHWIDVIMTYDMTSVWKNENLDACGVNYFTIGAMKNGLSERFNPNSPYYQAWLGGYIVKFSDPKVWSLRNHYELGVADQKNWLRLFGNTNPFVEVDYKKAKEIGKIQIGGYTGKLYEGGMWSDTDVGAGNKRRPLLSKKWDSSSILTSYQRIYLYGYIAIIEITSDIKAVLYANGAIYKDKNGKDHDTFHEIQSELKSLIQHIEIKTV